jgi:ribonucleoside-triphosphate reductase
MSVRELQKFTAVSKYARHVAELGRRETWPETVGRSKEMMLAKYPGRAGRIRRLYDEYVLPMKVLPSMRGMQFGGPPVFKHNARLYNCSASYVDRLSFFGEAFYLLLCGSGVGYSVQERHLRHLPNFSKARLAGRKLPKKTYVVPDMIEGWANCAHVQLTSYHDRPVPGFEEYLDCDVEFDYSLVRAENSPLSYGVGRAPGPKPLARAMARNKALLRRALEGGLTRLDSVTASDYHLNDSDAVASGGVRRSANLCLFDLFDLAMVLYKTGNWQAENPQRARANVSAMLLRGGVAWGDFWRLFESTRQFGEPGFYWSDEPDAVPNPCCEIGLLAKLVLAAGDPALDHLLRHYDGPVLRSEGAVELSGFQMCNLTTQNGKLVKTPGDLYEFSDAAAELGTYQAGFDEFPFLGEVTERIVRREALLGVSIAGVMHNPGVMLDPAVLREAAGRCRARNEEAAAAVGINPAARLTCEKPDGNSASTLGSYSGAHAGKIRRGFRVSQANRADAVYQYFRAHNPEACEESAWSRNKTDDVIRFCVEYDGLLEDDMTAVEFLDHVRTLQNHWVEPGTVVGRCVRPGVRHNVSCTVKVRDHEWEGVARHLFAHQREFGGVSFIGAHGDRDYAQAPFTPVFTARELAAMYGRRAVIAAASVLRHAPGGPSHVLWRWCDAALGIGGEPPEAGAFLRALHAAAGREFGGDLRKAVYAVKDVYNHRLHRTLKASYREVDYAGMREEVSGVNFQGEVACAGGACEL